MSLSESIPRQHEVTALLNSLANPGSDSSTAAAQLLPLVYDELRDLARKMFGMRNRDQTLQPTALVHEAFVRLVRQGSPGWQSSEHFFNVAAMAMRQLLCDQARRRRAEKRGGDWNRVTLDEAFAPNVGSTVDLLELDEALTRLATECPRQARIVELRFLAGLSVDEAAHALSISPRTVENEWRFARAWLRRELERGLG